MMVVVPSLRDLRVMERGVWYVEGPANPHRSRSAYPMPDPRPGPVPPPFSRAPEPLPEPDDEVTPR